MDSTPLATAELDRRIDLAGPLNFRDVGGYPTTDGRRVRWRRVFRSDGLWRVDEDDARHITEVLGLTTIIDLRTDAELAEYGRGALEGAGLDYHHVPVFDETQRMDPNGFRATPMHDMYLLMLRQYGANVAQALHVLADHDTHPAVFHCAAGKDRTGIVAAMLLGLLGVADDDIVADYALTTEILPAMWDRFRAAGIDKGLDPAEVDTAAPLFRAEAGTMTTVLAEVRRQWGSIEGWAQSFGIDRPTVAALQGGLLE